MKKVISYLYKPYGRTKGFAYGLYGTIGERSKNGDSGRL